jgi:hypothetical protein
MEPPGSMPKLQLDVGSYIIQHPNKGHDACFASSWIANGRSLSAFGVADGGKISNISY